MNPSGVLYTQEQFESLVRDFVKSVNMLPWTWSKGEGVTHEIQGHRLLLILTGTGTEDDEFLTFRKDMIFNGLMYMARYMACQYADGLSNVNFWKSDMYLYNLKGKVCMIKFQNPRHRIRGVYFYLFDEVDVFHRNGGV